MRFPIVPLLILLLPFAEIAGFILVGQAIGVWATLGLVVLTSVIGAILLRVQGFGLLNKIASESQRGRDPGRELVHGAMIVIAGLLLLIPGFITDIVGLLMFIPFVRELIWKLLRQRMVIFTSASRFGAGFQQQRQTSPDRVVDLDDEDFHRNSDPNSPWADRKRIDE
ncbi:membrane protein FxsA [Rhizobiaceae bacterium n13]|uniref:Membrane protein FxsA n=1 Tax=Ferirhizobium litorale TaxID=2927786 RepID=A0AAE3QE27_9HYPH|nr:FxsA family protein [Fererhizobium litorale]MDI7863042.1 membrane protein FxsA [Fererhizobium litorale]MDI7923281.1 membrane protein FxsA [Fererhizobium litorale]